MIYSDVSCVVENTLKKFVDLSIDKMLKIDFFALITMTKYRKILIDGEINYSSIEHDVVIKLLQEKSDDLYKLEDGTTYKFLVKDRSMDIVVVPVRAQANYKVFCICCSLDKSYTERDLAIMKFLTKVTYENVLLDNDIIKERNYFKNVFDSADVSILCFDLEGIITSANKSTFDVFGLAPEDIIGKNYYMLVAEEEKKVVEDRILSVVENNKICNAKNRIFKKTVYGEKYMDLSYCPLNNNKNQVEGIMLIARDTTKLRIYERQLEELKQFAVLGELAAGVAHDIRNPLMSIRGCARILVKKLSHQSKMNAFIEPIIDEVDRIDKKIKQMLSYSFITQEDIYSLLDINEVLEKCFNVVSFHKESKYINIEKKFSEELPLIRGNNVQLQQAFLNILFNAVQAIEVEGTITIENYNLEQDNKVLVSIRDNGKGISSKGIDQIFNPFYTTKDKGTGLGLSIVKRVIEKNGGEIVVNSKLDEGTEFKVYLPY
ncbi:MAG: ATP-binding protein [Rickettsiales bacterium]|nr:ATP-binding protein [Rickettsiales bacterium]